MAQNRLKKQNVLHVAAGAAISAGVALAGAAISAGVALAGGQQLPSQVSLKLLSSDPTSAKDWSIAKDDGANKNSCKVIGLLSYEIEIEPQDFTGIVSAKKTLVEFAGKLKSTDHPYNATFINGKQIEGGLIIYKNTHKSGNPKEYQAICSIQSPDDIKLISIGDPALAYPGVKIMVANPKPK